MKLIELHIQAFGPFAKRQTVDFTALGNNPLFLIDGPTGAGKSSILHAVCFALYGETTDVDRKDIGVRSDHADQNDLTEVSLTFMTRGETYRISRTPTQERPSQRGGGTTKAQASANLVRINQDGSEESLVTKKKTEADRYIREILGLSADQFRQVMVLPQGKFRELLLSKSDERQEILSTLFQTHIFQRIEEILRQKAAVIEKQGEQFNAEKSEVLAEHEVESVESLNEKLTAQKVAMDAAEQAGKVRAEKYQKLIEELTKAEGLEKLFVDKEQIVTDLARYKAQEDEHARNTSFLALADRAWSIAPLWRELEQAKAASTRLQSDLIAVQSDQSSVSAFLESCEKVLQRAQEAAKNNDAKRIELERLNAVDLLLAQLAEASKEVSIWSTQLAGVVGQIVKAAKDITLTEDASNEAERVQAANSKRLLTKPDLIGQQATLRHLLLQLKQRDAVLDQISNAAVSVGQSKQSVADALEQVQSAERTADRLELKWLQAQAAILAEKLEEGDPCPVCGNCSHPSLASFDSESRVDKAMVDTARTELAQCRERHSQAVSVHQQALKRAADLSEQRDQMEVSLGDDFTVSVDDCDQRLRKLEQDISDLLKLETEQEKIANQLLKLKKALTDQRVELETLSKTKHSAEIEHTKHQTHLTNILDQIPIEYRDKAVVDAAIKRLNNEIVSSITALSSAQADYKSANDRLIANSERQKTLDEKHREAIDRQNSCEVSWSETLSSSQFEGQEEFSSALIAQEELDALRAAIQAHRDAINDLNSQLTALDRQIAEKKRPELLVLRDQVAAENSKLESERKLYTDCRDLYRAIQVGVDKIKQVNEQLKAIQDEYNVIGKLSRAASGRGKYRVSLERFVLASLLDDVLSLASKRLHLMSKGQYSLVRENETGGNKQRAAGLNLAVDDAHSGKVRPVSTLSGGESFMASLALALALSDVVQQRSGGIQMDTLFVDEGFGSLDQDSLQLAIETLVDIQATGRTIGIISHVSELKEQMAKRIDVVSGTNGSEIKVAAV